MKDTTEKDMEAIIAEALEFADDDDNGGIPELDSVYTFEQEGLLTRNKGLIVNMADGSQFQVTIVKSR